MKILINANRTIKIVLSFLIIFCKEINIVCILIFLSTHMLDIIIVCFFIVFFKIVISSEGWLQDNYNGLAATVTSTTSDFIKMAVLSTVTSKRQLDMQILLKLAP